MSVEDISISEFVDKYRFEPDNCGYVGDIGMGNDYGIAVRGKLDYNGEKLSVLGAVVLDTSTGEPKIDDENTSFTCYGGSLDNSDETVYILEGEDAVEAMEKIYQQAHGDSDMYSKRSNVDIPRDAI